MYSIKDLTAYLLFNNSQRTSKPEITKIFVKKDKEIVISDNKKII